MKKYLNGMMTGIVVGAVGLMIIVPQLDRRTQRKVRRAGRRIADFAGDSYENVRGII